MKHKILGALGFFLIITLLATTYLFLFEPKYNGLINTESNDILLFAHRGFGNQAPDNSLIGARLALEIGLDGVDMDAQFSKDKKTFIFHDVSLERFTIGKGRVDSYTLDELREFDLGAKYDDGTEFKNVYIESFETFVQEVTPEALLMVELKIATTKDTGMEQDIIDVIEKYNVIDKVYLSSFNPVVLYRLKKINPRIQTVFIFQDSDWDTKRVSETKEADRVALPWYLQSEWARRAIRKIIKPDALSINERVKEQVIDTLIDEGWPVFLWSLNTEKSMEWGLSKKLYGIVTDEPILTKEIHDRYESN